MPEVLLEVSAACDALADHLSAVLCREQPDLHRDVVTEVVTAELFACAQDMARLFAPLSPDESEALKSTLRRMDEEGIA